MDRPHVIRMYEVKEEIEPSGQEIHPEVIVKKKRKRCKHRLSERYKEEDDNRVIWKIINGGSRMTS